MYDEERWAKADADLQGAYVGVAGLVEGMYQDAQRYLLTDRETGEIDNMQTMLSHSIDRLEELRKRAEKRWKAAEKRSGTS